MLQKWFYVVVFLCLSSLIVVTAQAKQVVKRGFTSIFMKMDPLRAPISFRLRKIREILLVQEAKIIRIVYIRGP